MKGNQILFQLEFKICHNLFNIKVAFFSIPSAVEFLTSQVKHCWIKDIFPEKHYSYSREHPLIKLESFCCNTEREKETKTNIFSERDEFLSNVWKTEENNATEDWNKGNKAFLYVPIYESNPFTRRTTTFGQGKAEFSPITFRIAANIVKFKVMQDRVFTSLTVACRPNVSLVPLDHYIVTDCAPLQQRPITHQLGSVFLEVTSFLLILGRTLQSEEQNMTTGMEKCNSSWEREE